jgi:hypothetical protein
MRANAVEGVELPLNIEQGDDAIPGDNFAARTGKNVRGGGDREPSQDE